MKKTKSILVAVAVLFLFSCSSKDKKKNQEVATDRGAIATESMSFDIRGSDSGLINGLFTVYFDFDKSVLSQNEQKKLGLNAMWLRNNPNQKMTIEGHTDEVGSSEYNLSLGERRALFVKNQLIKMGIQSNRLTIVSYGEEKPFDNRDTDEARSKNRRANFLPN